MKQTSATSKTARKDGNQTTKSALKERSVKIPNLVVHTEIGKLRVQKLYFDLETEGTHQENDPFLSFLKAAVCMVITARLETPSGLPTPTIL